MPYDEQGNFIYPVPTRKGRPIRRPPTPKSPAPVEPLPFPTPTKDLPIKITNAIEPILSVVVTPEITPPAIEVPPPLVLPSADGAAVFFVQEGNNRWQMSELDLAQIWNAQLWPDGLKLMTTDGRPVEAVYRGRWSGGFGPDFGGAIVRIGTELYKGAVELHLQSGDWRLHGHHQDARYNDVVLQVVLEDNQPASLGSQTQAGQILPVLALLPLYRQAKRRLSETLEAAKASGTRLGSLSESDGPCCDRVADHEPNLATILTHLDELGDRRFEEKAIRFEAASAADTDDQPGEAAQALWAGLLEALGYSQNKAPFRRLAATLPLSAVVELDREAVHRRESAEERLLNLEATLLGAAGLLPSQRRLKGQTRRVAERPARFDPTGLDVPDPEDYNATRYTDDLERRWDWQIRQLRATLADWQPLRESDWTFARLRPPNHPARRIAGLARLIVRWKLTEPAELIEMLAEPLTLPPAEAHKGLNALLRVELEEADTDSAVFWLRRFDFSDRAIMADQRGQQAHVDLIGADRAADMVVNVVLPFLAAFGRDRRRNNLTRAALATYSVHPKLAPNELIENVARQVFRHWLEEPEAAHAYLDTLDLKNRPATLTVARLITGARRQQALLHLHHNFCADQNYAACPLS